MYNVKKVNKPWGYEIWIADGVQSPYAVKKIFFKKGNRTSLQVHRKKYETNYVLEGLGFFLKSKEKFDIDKFLDDGLSDHDILIYENSLEKIDLKPGVYIDVEPEYVHRVIALTDLTFLETSSTELDDVIRIQDDQGRGHGKIAKEHE